MAGFLSPVYRWQVFQNGQPAAGAKLFSYLSGGTTPSPLYNNADVAPAHAHTNPVIADSTGTFPVLYLANLNYRFLVTDALGVTIFPAQDDISVPGSIPGPQTYTPTVLNIGNVANASVTPCQFMRVGNVVTVSGGIGLILIAPATLTTFTMSLPIPSVFTSSAQCGGTACAPQVFGYVGAILADTVGNTAIFQLTPATTIAGQFWSFHFTYLVL